jgi:predicted MFS family arabinose efflux permease
MSSQGVVQASQPEVSTPAGAWTVVWCLFIVGDVGCFNFMKVPPLMPVLIDHFKLNLASAGLMMSLIGVTGLLLVLPAGIVVMRYGIKVVALTAMAFSTAGCLLGALAASYPVFLVSRGLEGISFSLLAVVGGTAAGIWFPPQKVGVPMGVMCSSMGVSGILAMAIAPLMAQSFGWRSIWWVTGVLSLLSLLAIAIFVRMPPWMSVAAAVRTPPWMNVAAAAREGAIKKPGLGEAFANRNIWLVSAAFLLFYIPNSALGTYYVDYLTKVRGFTMVRAGLFNCFSMVGLLIGAPLAGYLLNKVRNIKLILTVNGLLLGLLSLLPFHISGILVPIWLLLFGVFGAGVVSTVCLAAVPKVLAKPELVGVGMAIAGLGMNLAGIVGAPYFGAIVDRAGWNAGAYALIPAILLGFIANWITRYGKYTEHF